jgi:hypothetical protein
MIVVTKKNKRTMLRLIFSAFTIGILGLAGVGIYSIYKKYSAPTETTVSLTKVSGPDVLQHKGDRIIYQYSTTNSHGHTT